MVCYGLKVTVLQEPRNPRFCLPGLTKVFPAYGDGDFSNFLLIPASSSRRDGVFRFRALAALGAGLFTVIQDVTPPYTAADSCRALRLEEFRLPLEIWILRLVQYLYIVNLPQKVQKQRHGPLPLIKGDLYCVSYGTQAGRDRSGHGVPSIKNVAFLAHEPRQEGIAEFGPG